MLIILLLFFIGEVRMVKKQNEGRSSHRSSQTRFLLAPSPIFSLATLLLKTANDCHATQIVNYDSYATQINFNDYHATQNPSLFIYYLYLLLSHLLYYYYPQLCSNLVPFLHAYSLLQKGLYNALYYGLSFYNCHIS